MRWEFASPILLLVVWQVLAMLFPGRLFPTPIAVAIELWTDIVDGKLIADMAKTLRRAAISFTIAMALGTAIGILFGRSRFVDRLFSTWVIVGLNLPAVVIAIVLYIWLGLNEL
ncbi:MAG TPA: ABC transporter permease, partial [Devosia sp.]|nr:ABC transporter permease [Devosia sp.]